MCFPPFKQYLQLRETHQQYPRCRNATVAIFFTVAGWKVDKCIRGGGTYLRLGRQRQWSVCKMHMLGGSGGMLLQKIFIIMCSEIASEAIFFT